MKLFKTTIVNFFVLLIFILGLSFFAFPQSADACSVKLDSSFRFRTSEGNGGFQSPTWFTEEHPPFVYVDFQRHGDCNPTTDKMHLTIFGLTENAEVSKTVDNFEINVAALSNGGMTIAFTADEGPCYANNSDTALPDCLVFAVITDLPTDNPEAKILGILGNLITGISNIPTGPGQPSQAQIFANAWGGNGNQPTPTCANSGGHFYMTSQNCPLSAYNTFNGLFPSQVSRQKFLDYYNTNDGNSQTDIYSLVEPQVVGSGAGVSISPNSPPAASLAYPSLTYKCQGACAYYDEWQAKGVLSSYGGTHPDDEGSIAVNPPSVNYQEEYIPLADLPFEGLNGGPTPSLGEYLASIFRMAIVVIVILAVLMIVYHGVAYATTGAVGKKDDHRTGVWNAVLGLVLALGSWLLLNTVSPRLASQLSIGIPEVNLDGDAESISTSGSTDTNGTITAFTLPTNMGFYCPGSGGSTEIPSIIDSFNNKVTYRWGGKGGSLPSGGKFKLSPNEQNSGGYMCTNDSGQSIPCRNFCPLESVCLDCSGFVNHVRQCAGMSIYAGTTSMVTNSSAIAIDMKTLSSDGKSLTINGSNYNLQPGDILVWKGHVVVYYGNGIIAESKGDLASIKNKNKNIKKTNLAQSNYKKKITHLIKANP